MGRKKHRPVELENLYKKTKDLLNEMNKQFMQMEMDRFILIGRKMELTNVLTILESALAAPTSSSTMRPALTTFPAATEPASSTTTSK